tara:strand:- start:216 stop:545 length:330 start_codon:yes stop_codon:yes gene_type:complete
MTGLFYFWEKRSFVHSKITAMLIQLIIQFFGAFLLIRLFKYFQQFQLLKKAGFAMIIFSGVIYSSTLGEMLSLSNETLNQVVTWSIILAIGIVITVTTLKLDELIFDHD